MKLYQKIARVASQKNTPKKAKELSLLQELLPNGNVIGLQRHNLSTVSCIISLKSTHKRIVIDTAYWHPIIRQWTEHQVVITPSFEGEINIRITGKNEGDIKEYLWDIFREALMKEYAVFKKGWEVKDSSEIESELDYELD
jgi:hypothetical protein